MSRFSALPAGTTVNRLRDEMDHLFGGLLGNAPLFDLATPRTTPAGYPAVNVWEDDDTLFVEAELPGLHIDDVEIVVKNNEVSISGEHKAQVNQEAAYHRSERRVGKFQRQFKFSFPINADAVSATLNNGLLALRLPKAAEARARKIEVKRS